MTDMNTTPKQSLLAPDARTKKRNAAEARFRAYGIGALLIAMGFLIALMWSIFGNGIGAFTQTFVKIQVPLEESVLDPNGNREPADLARATTLRYGSLLQGAMASTLEREGITTDMEPAALAQILSSSAAAEVRNRVLAEPSLIGQTVELEVLASSRVDGYMKGRVSRESLARDRNLSPAALNVVDQMRDAGVIERRFNWNFIFGSDASDQRPEQAGIGVSMLGSLAMMLVVLALSLPIGVAASIYLEEFAPQNRFTDLIEVNISNLAAVPSIVFGILGLAVFIQIMHLPQSAPVVGGLVLTLMTLPTIIISTRAALKAVPPSIRDAALGIGASRMQAVFHHVLPLAMPGILTGTILGLAQALGETAPLLLIGMVGFIASNYPGSVDAAFNAPNSAMPAQIYEWAKRADPAFYERAWGGIILLLVFLLLMNFLAVLLRRRFERKW
ncbi:phosphate ABC transporter, permease protein [Ketogulonicigenium vulgare Y25]|uniref:Phosphate transport system permease protein PstA n=1 Tax=Ketogulonicigenium vulgare (strain WSH-001) TaxID=759362 RepID=F9Y9M7_KETVW|nr:phosphate ABC transporter permease PstA [Ketogulonicigenium vulgare]ADO41346.1 phosphate ABC transporter, permease protein [Ketogulonicigenium vulgare Y25]AEM41365.1 Phosphate ABC transporter, permease protein [Ketogulonicigenium vulgare WSH-001]ALJ81504.1 phosphate ABC transporter permease [Ketogulonicigenium vulgare]AOZ55110.1 phosphate ABC transporter permease [Ketogulonicigenium vulgare]